MARAGLTGIEKVRVLERGLAVAKVAVQDEKKFYFAKGGDVVRAAFARQFSRVGAEFGTPWRPLSSATLRYKNKLAAGNKGPLIRTGALRDSTSKRSSLHIEVIRGDRIEFLSARDNDRGYSLVLIHERGAKWMPRRRIRPVRGRGLGGEAARDLGRMKREGVARIARLVDPSSRRGRA